MDTNQTCKREAGKMLMQYWGEEGEATNHYVKMVMNGNDFLKKEAYNV